MAPAASSTTLTTVRVISQAESTISSNAAAPAAKKGSSCRQYRVASTAYLGAFAVVSLGVLASENTSSLNWVTLALAIAAVIAAAWNGYEVHKIPDLQDFKRDVALLDKTAAAERSTAIEYKQGADQLVKDGEEEEEERKALAQEEDRLRNLGAQLGQDERDVQGNIQAGHDNVLHLKEVTANIEQASAEESDLIKTSKKHIATVQSTLAQAGKEDQTLQRHAEELTAMLQQMEHGC